jgi:hypothetical protein
MSKGDSVVCAGRVVDVAMVTGLFVAVAVAVEVVIIPSTGTPPPPLWVQYVYPVPPK